MFYQELLEINPASHLTNKKKQTLGLVNTLLDIL